MFLKAIGNELRRRGVDRPGRGARDPDGRRRGRPGVRPPRPSRSARSSTRRPRSELAAQLGWTVTRGRRSRLAAHASLPRSRRDRRAGRSRALSRSGGGGGRRRRRRHPGRARSRPASSSASRRSSTRTLRFGAARHRAGRRPARHPDRRRAGGGELGHARPALARPRSRWPRHARSPAAGEFGEGSMRPKVEALLALRGAPVPAAPA